jgi:hypothetical protein
VEKSKAEEVNSPDRVGISDRHSKVESIKKDLTPRPGRGRRRALRTQRTQSREKQVSRALVACLHLTWCIIEAPRIVALREYENATAASPALSVAVNGHHRLS